MIIIVEGSNKVGKSSIINKLKSLHGVENVYNRSILKSMKDVKQESFISALAMIDVIDSVRDKDFILDRFHLSELVYGEVERGYRNENMLTVDKELSSRKDILLVLVTSDYNHIPEGNLKLRYQSIQDRFKDAFKESNIKNKIMIKLEDIV